MIQAVIIDKDLAQARNIIKLCAVGKVSICRFPPVRMVSHSPRQKNVNRPAVCYLNRNPPHSSPGHPGKQHILAQCWFNVGPASATLTQH